MAQQGIKVSNGLSEETADINTILKKKAKKNQQRWLLDTQRMKWNTRETVDNFSFKKEKRKISEHFNQMEAINSTKQQATGWRVAWAQPRSLGNSLFHPQWAHFDQISISTKQYCCFLYADKEQAN